MEHVTQTQQTLDTLLLHVEDSPILPIVIPLFDTLNYQDEYYPNRVTERDGDAQLFWEIGELPNYNFERLCLTLSKHTLSLTIALDLQPINRRNDIPVIPYNQVKTPMRSTLVINTNGHALYESTRHNGVLTDNLYGDEAIAHFTPKLTHTLASLGLYNFEQNMQQEVS